MQKYWHHVQQVLSDTLGLSPGVVNRLALTLLTILTFLALWFLISALIHRRVGEISRRYILQKTVNYVMGFLAAAFVLRIWLGGLSGMAAYLGILSAGLAIALQDPLTNFAGWIFILLRKPFVVGDRIQIGAHSGDVVDIRLFQFTIVEIGNWVSAENSTGRIIHIPNGWVFKQAQANYTQGFNFIWNEIPVTITFESNWQKARKILAEIADRHSAVRNEQAAEEVRKAARKYLIFFEYLTPSVWTSVADIGVTLTLRLLCEPRNRRAETSRIWEEILLAFAGESDIDFAYPTTRFYDNALEGKPGTRAKSPAGDDGAGGPTA
jgi:small-conductance mechanosensitive channel